MPKSKSDPFTIVIAITIAIILILAVINFIIPKKPQSNCGNRECEAGENQSNCCTDCGCSTGYECTNTTCTLISQCPNCPPPSVWSNCTTNQQSRFNYYCNSSTDYNCQIYNETRDCSTNCTEGYLNSYRCSNSYLQRQYQYSNCSIVWTNFQYCSYGCLNEECIIPAPTNKCSDNTPNLQCSRTLPKYCDNGNLIDKCIFCGCDSGYACLANGSCTNVIPATDPYFCLTTCILVSTSGDPYIYKIYSGYSWQGQSLNVSCVSTEYYNSNNPTYHYQTDVYIPKSECVCSQTMCSVTPTGPIFTPD